MSTEYEIPFTISARDEKDTETKFDKNSFFGITIIALSVVIVTGIVLLTVFLVSASSEENKKEPIVNLEENSNEDWPEDNSTNYIKVVYSCPGEYKNCYFYDSLVINHNSEISSITVDGKRVAIQPYQQFNETGLKTVIIKF